jgi:ATP-GRASP peptide maturase of grasp-with-spasm system
LWRKLKEKHWVTKPSEISTKKLEVIEIANKHGILVPRTLVTTSKKELVEFKRVNGRVITKTVGDVPNFRNDGKFYSMRTEEISDDFLNNDVPDFFFPSLFQALIEKEIELRIFFLFDRFFSMAIFSQSNKDTELDFRNYDYKKPNRMTPFRLPIWLEHKLKLLTSSLKLTTGSIDIIKEKATGSYYLLEINPVGQFGMTSHPCNYYLERELAKQLIRYDE